MLPKLARWGAPAAIAGGAAWLVKVAIITALDGHFQPIESVFFLGGLIAIVAGSVGVSAAVAARASAWVRPVAFLVTLVAGLALSFFLLEGAQGLVEGTGNEGLDEELGVFAVGLMWVVLGGILYARGRPARADGHDE